MLVVGWGPEYAATSPRCRFDCPPPVFFVYSFTQLCLRRSDAHNVTFSNRRSTGSGKLLTSGSSADLVLASHPRRSPTCLQERCCEETLTFHDIPRQPCNKLVWVVVPSSTDAICFATCDGSQSHTKCEGILGRDCSPPSPVPAHKLASKQAYLSIWFSTLLSFGPHLWFCLSQWCHVLRDCGTILQGASKHITTTLWRVIQHQHDLDSHFAQTSECQASLYIIKCYSMCSCRLACSIINIYKFTQITQTPGKLLWLPFWNKLPLPVGIEPLNVHLFPLRIYCVHLCSGFVSKDGKRAMWMYDNCNIYGIYDI